MAFTEVEVAVKQIDKNTWELLEPVEYCGKQRKFIVPKGFRTDFASVPILLTWLVPRYGVYTKAVILHDFLYYEAAISRKDADGILRRVMRELDVPFLRRWMMWAAVRIFGSYLEGVTWREFLQILALLVVAIPLLIVPLLVVGTTLVVFWLIEMLLYLVFKTNKHFTGKKRSINHPEILGPLKH